MARRFVNRGRKPLGRGAVLEKRWLGFSSTFIAFGAGSIAINVATATDSTDTIMRTRGNLVAFLDSVTEPGVLVQVTVGLHIVPEGTGTTILADPFGDSNAGRWFYWTAFQLGYEELVADVVDIPIISGYREVIDAKAMRIGKPDTEIQAVVTNTTLATADGVNLSLAGRILLGR